MLSIYLLLQANITWEKRINRALREKTGDNSSDIGLYRVSPLYYIFSLYTLMLSPYLQVKFTMYITNTKEISFPLI